jgi:TPR repeat protein
MDSDPDAARGWLERAAGAGNSNAMNNLGALLMESDPDAAREWYKRAASHP